MYKEEVKTVCEKVLWILKRGKNEIIKKKVINKRASEIIWKCKNLLYLPKKIENKYLKDKKYCKVKDHCHYTIGYSGAAHSICNLK